MRVGDVLEWLAAVALTYALYLIDARAGAAITAAACLVYFGQCYGAHKIPVPKVRLRRRAPKQ
jgi:hypothetical protein